MPQRSGLKREPIDKFYTCPAVVALCVDAFKKTVMPARDHWLVEPSAGAGAFVPAIKDMSSKHMFIDIEPEHADVERQDFLTFAPPIGTIHVIGNPPFGRQASTAIAFIKHAATFASTIAFILPRSFCKDSMKRHVPRRFHLQHQVALPEDAFLMNGEPYHVPCVFQIWQRHDVDREMPIQLSPTGFAFVRRDESPHIAMRRVGVNAGRVDRATMDKSPQSHYFIRFDDEKKADELAFAMSQLSFPDDNTVGPRSISKQELIAAANPLMRRSNQ